MLRIEKRPGRKPEKAENMLAVSSNVTEEPQLEQLIEYGKRSSI